MIPRNLTPIYSYQNEYFMHECIYHNMLINLVYSENENIFDTILFVIVLEFIEDFQVYKQNKYNSNSIRINYMTML